MMLLVVVVVFHRLGLMMMIERLLAWDIMACIAHGAWRRLKMAFGRGCVKTAFLFF
jgi:hypothetical protein